MEAFIGMAGCDGFEGGLEPGVGLDPVQLRYLDERSDVSPRGAACTARTRSPTSFKASNSRTEKS